MSENSILDPKNDWVFKLMFTKGELGNKALISFLNAFLAKRYGKITMAEVLNTELIRDSPHSETYRLDLLVKTDNRLIINVEMQQFWQSSYPRRIALYLSETIARFLRLNPKANQALYAISFTVFAQNVPEKVKLPIGSKDSGFEFLYLELSKEIEYTLSKDIKDYSEKDYWVRFLANYKEDKNTKELELLCKNNEGVDMAEKVLLTVTEEERQIAREISENNYRRMIALETEIARTEAREKALAEGRAEGLAEGRAEGLAEGELKKARETARKFKRMGLPLEKIAEGCGLGIEEIKRL